MSSAAKVGPKEFAGSDLPENKKVMLFWACFAALIATAFGFIVRVFLIPEWGDQFGMTEVQKGRILGAGLWPFSISIILFSLVIDRIGYGKAMAFAFACHVASAVMLITARSYDQLYWGSFVGALANGTVEAAVNPVVATLFPNEKTKWLNRLHAGWPGGLVLGGILALIMGPGTAWQWKVGLVLIPTAIYGVMMLGAKFPVSERVAAGVSYKEMLKEFGVLGALMASFLVFAELGNTFGWNPWVIGAIVVAVTLAFGATINFAPGRPLFLVLMAIMIPLAITELGVDSWITDLMGPEMIALGLQAGWVLVYTSVIMMILRFFAGSIVHRISPLGLLAVSAAIAAIGLAFLSKAAGATILVAATLYGLGKTFFWPTMLGVVAEQFPRGGALTLNAIAGVGMLAVGVVGNPFLGYIQDTSVNSHLQRENAAIHQQVATEKQWVFGQYVAPDPGKIATLPEADQAAVKHVSDVAKKEALLTVTIFPIIMLLGYLALLGYFKSRGGYKAEVLAGHAAEDEEFTGGVKGPVR
ncbi:MAG: MFS transporter [Armatimonadota bacterium]